ncbi:ATP-dependent DNA helicase CHL1 [Sparassis crispa]|uniref:ATP-dependent DNA helicase CHL1 n=1 Tax=Sparassis crispa TaxID=139825 RepID=A0A401GZ90_9APHY|nr:ATP-dependent DNA helicase CHL1 [Sparassis crispa]GBE87470.1 ATP-dependent DNA helicase CHL1 [Sparassis crispa]
MSLKLTTPEAFPAFPFTPYHIQLDLMRHLYTSIEDRKVSIVESPTGTGKTLSLLCASLTWLRDEQNRARQGQLDALAGDGPDWVLSQTVERRRRELEADELEYAAALAKARKKEAAMRMLANGRVRKRMKLVATEDTSNDVLGDEDAAFLPDSQALSDDNAEQSNISPAVRALMQKLQQGATASTSRHVHDQEPTCTKIYYASRTHSQLAQVLHELRKLQLLLNVSVAVSPGAPQSSLPSIAVGTHTKRPILAVNLEADKDGDSADDISDNSCNVRAVSLGSRKQLCINQSLRGHVGDLDEACRQMLSEKGKKRCGFLPPQDEEIHMLDLRDQILATPKDIEDLLLTGKIAETCPYFGSRRAIPQAQLVLLPYNLLLQKTAREALGINLKDQVVIIDEAHNLISTLLSLSTTCLPLRTLSTARHQLSIYLSRFRTRLATAHALHLARLMGLLDVLTQYAEEWRDMQTPRGGEDRQEPARKTESKHRCSSVEVITSDELLRRLGRKAEGVNLLEVERYLRNSKIARKISAYSLKALEKAAGHDPAKLSKLARLSSNTPPLHAVENFISALTAASDDGRVTFSMVDRQVEIKYQHLNPSTYFQEVIDEARSVVLAGGTMSPISDMTNQLFADLPGERMSTFSCGHIIPPANLQTLVLKRGPRGHEMQFKFEQRSDLQVIAELGQMLVNFASIIPGGMVVFLPSYAFLHTVMIAWEKSGLLVKIAAKKRVFSEPQESGQVETVLREYATEIHDWPQNIACASAEPRSSKAGAMLFAVIGAKLSEGLNFTDDLARAVIIIGLPFANLASPELRERMNYVNRLEQRRSGGGGVGAHVKAPNGAKDAATELYENMCMNAVNQSIGRAIRHRGDWASLVLVDSRYTSPRIRNKLPNWIGKNTIVTDGFGQAMKEMGKFYRSRREG